MGLQDLIVIARRQFGNHGPALGFSSLLLIGVVLFPSFPLWGLCCSLVLSIDGARLQNVFGGSVMLQKENC